MPHIIHILLQSSIYVYKHYLWNMYYSKHFHYLVINHVWITTLHSYLVAWKFSRNIYLNKTNIIVIIEFNV